MASSDPQPEPQKDNFLAELADYVKEELAKPSPGTPEPKDAAASTPQDS